MADQEVTNLMPPFTGGLPVPPLDSSLFPEDFPMEGGFISDLDLAALDADIEDFDLIFDDLCLPLDTGEFINSLTATEEPHPTDPLAIAIDLSNPHDFDRNSGDGTSSAATLNNASSHVFSEASGDQSPDVSKFLNVSSPESSRQSGNNNSWVNRVLDYPSSESETRKGEPASSQDSGNCGSNASEGLNCSSSDSANCDRSADSSPNPVNEPIKGIVDPKIKFEEETTNCLLKRKKETEDVSFESRMSKFRRSHGVESTNSPKASTATITDEDEKKKARLMRNRESAQLSRQRKKHYVEDLQDKMKSMHSTIQDLTAKISYIMAENASLRQQLNGGAMCPPPVAPSGMYPHPSMAPMGYPWAPYPPYVMKPPGSQVPLVPIPRLKSQQPASAPKSKKSENKKTAEVKKTETKSKKVASVSFLGLFFFIFLFGGLVPMVNLKFGGKSSAYNYGESYYPESRFYDHNGRVLAVNRHVNGSQSDMVGGDDFIGKVNCKTGVSAGHCGGRRSNNEPIEEESKLSSMSPDFGLPSNTSDTLSAYLYVPRNDKLVKIDGNLIIHSIMASEKAMTYSSRDVGKKIGEETGLAVPAVHTQTGRGVGVNPHYYRSSTEKKMALGSGEGKNSEFKSKSADGKLQQWFKEGLSGALLSPGMCHEVFQFDVTPSPGAMVPATSVVNSSVGKGQNSTQFAKGRNRRILESVPIPLPASNINITKEPMGIDPESLHSNKSNSPMVVSVLVDPREAGDVDGEGVMGPKSLSRVFVVVLVDSVKYVTYSCGLPFKGSSSSRVTT